MDRPRALAVVLACLAAAACAGDGSRAAPADGPRAEGGAGPDASAQAGLDGGAETGAEASAETSPGACACAPAGPDLSTSLDCFCQQGDCGPRDLSRALAEVEQELGCYQVREYAGCGLRAIGRRAGFDPRHQLWVFDVATGMLVGVRATSDIPSACPFGDRSQQGRDLLGGRSPEQEGCAQSGCQETCDGSPVASCTLDQ